MKRLVCLFLLSFSVLSSNQPCDCTHLDGYLNLLAIPEDIISKFDMPAPEMRQGTWVCKKCGYENYDQLRYCGVCGNDHYR